MKIQMKDIVYTKCQEYNPLSDKADLHGMKTFWRADVNGTPIAYGDTKKECIEETRRYIKEEKK